MYSTSASTKSFTTKTHSAFNSLRSSWKEDGSLQVKLEDGGDIKCYDFAYINHGVQTARAVSALDQLKIRYIKSRVEGVDVSEHLKATLAAFVPNWLIWAEERPVEVLRALRMNPIILPRDITPPPIEDTTIPKVGILFKILQQELEQDA